MFESVVLFVGGLGPTELFVILALFVLLFGASKLPELARASGQAMGEFRRGQIEVERELQTEAASVAPAPVEAASSGVTGSGEAERARID